MMGKSWGGFNALQTAALRPPALKAIITVCSTDDRYADDIHYMGGALLNDNLWWGAIMLAYQARPPDPASGRRRLARAMAGAAARPCRSSPRSGSRISGATPIGGTARSARIFPRSPAPFSRSAAGPTPTPTRSRACSKGLSVPRRGLIGPWAHLYPQDGAPGPAIGFLQEALRWWDHWLKDEDRGVMNEPMLRALSRNGRRPAIAIPRPAASSAKRNWPSPRIERRVFHLNRERAGRRCVARRRGDDPLALLDWPGRRRMDGHGRPRRSARRPAP